MAVHDEVMPKMGTIGKLIGQLEDKIKETDNPEVLIEARTALREANKAMMDWMKGFGDSFEGDEIMKGKALTEEKQKILDLEEKKVEALRDQINNSIKNAEEVLR
jgi:predicted transcriptional regulator